MGNWMFYNSNATKSSGLLEVLQPHKGLAKVGAVNHDSDCLFGNTLIL